MPGPQPRLHLPYDQWPAGIVTCKIPPDCEYQAGEIIKRMRKLWANSLKDKAPIVR